MQIPPLPETDRMLPSSRKAAALVWGFAAPLAAAKGLHRPVIWPEELQNEFARVSRRLCLVAALVIWPEELLAAALVLRRPRLL